MIIDIDMVVVDVMITELSARALPLRLAFAIDRKSTHCLQRNSYINWRALFGLESGKKCSHDAIVISCS